MPADCRSRKSETSSTPGYAKPTYLIVALGSWIKDLSFGENFLGLSRIAVFDTKKRQVLSTYFQREHDGDVLPSSFVAIYKN